MLWCITFTRGVSITANPTVSSAQQPSAVERLASERLALLGEAAGAKIELDRLIAAMGNGSSIPMELIAQQGELAALLREIGSASLADLPALKRAVASAVANVAAASSQADAAQRNQSADALADAVDASRRAVQSALDYTRNLDLDFASAEEERAYREREAERAAYIAAQQAKGTPQGDLNASGATIGQMADARAHGAQGPEFDTRWNDLVASTEALREQVRRNGGSTKEFDEHLRADLRRILKSKGLSDVQIDAQFALNPDPLNAAKAFVKSDGEMSQIARTTETSAQAAVRPATSMMEMDEPAIALNPDAVAAKLKASGIMVTEHDGEAFAHGVGEKGPTQRMTRIPG